MRPLTIGNVKLDGNIILAPMAGVTDLPFRIICREMGADLVCSEMVSAKGIFYNSKNTEALLATDEKEGPLSLQLFGSDPDIISEMAKKIEHRSFSILDINMGCPVPKVVNNAEGSALMENIPLASQIVEKTVKAINKPVTVKIRKGFHRNDETAVDMAKALEQAGASAIAVHGRTREDYYSGVADWSIIRKVKEAVTIPVIGNGDVDSPQKAKSLMDETGCDGVMIGRAARGNPWIFKRIKEYVATGMDYKEIDFSEVKAMIIRHAKMLVELKGEKKAILEMRTHAAWYTQGYKNSSLLRRALNDVTSLEELENLFEMEIKR